MSCRYDNGRDYIMICVLFPCGLDMRLHQEQQTTCTNIIIDQRLVDAGLKITGLKTCQDLVDFALRELVRRQQQRKLLDLKGKIQ